MRKLIGFLLLFFSVLACREPLLDSLPRFMREQDRFARDARGGKDSIGPEKPREQDVPAYVPSLYATALHFRDSVNWRTDSLGQADILFFKDGELVLQVSVESPPDPERHRIWDGHLWSDSTDGRETVVLCDGEERFRFEGEEHLQGFLLMDGNVHTLGQHPGRDGFCYRINGEAVFDSPKGSVLGSPSDPEWRGGALNRDGNSVYYCYCLPVAQNGREYHVMRGGEPYLTLPSSTSDALLDVRVHRDTVHRVERRGTYLYLIAGGEETYLNIHAPYVLSCKLIPYGEGLTAKGRSLPGGITCHNWFYDRSSGVICRVANGQSERGQLVLLPNNWAFADIGLDGQVQNLLLEREEPPLPEGDFSLTTPLSLFVSDEHYAFALTDRSGSKHVIVSSLGEQSYSFNGYFTSVRIE